jgi:L-aspartate oxidase
MPNDVDFLVVGSGIAGLSFAIKAARHGKVQILTKKRKVDSNTNYAQGGIAAVFGADDRYAYHIRDTLKTGEGLCHDDAVRIMVRNGPAVVKELNDMGCRFSTNDNGSFALSKEGGHSRNRIVHAKDYTGWEIERVLLEEAKRAGVLISENEVTLDLIIRDGECKGIIYFDTLRQDIRIAFARATILATGGIGQVYLHTTNPPIATGDGIAMAYRAGARIGNMEFVQFHPTAVYNIKIDGRSFLISEAVRGEGGILINTKGDPFMKRYHPAAELAPRDVVARACIAEIQKHGDPYVLLDISHRKADFIKNRFPTIYDTCYRWGIDITREPIPVTPAAHYLCGGIMVNTRAETSIPRLFALGECSCTGVHGANRLASNSLLEALVFSTRAAERIKRIFKSRVRSGVKIKPLTRGGPDLKIQIKELMTRSAGVVRSEAELNRAQVIADGYCAEFADGIHFLNAESRNMAEIARLIIRSCRSRKESRGLHYLVDYPRKNGRYRKDTVVCKKGTI